MGGHPPVVNGEREYVRLKARAVMAADVAAGRPDPALSAAIDELLCAVEPRDAETDPVDIN